MKALVVLYKIHEHRFTLRCPLECDAPWTVHVNTVALRFAAEWMAVKSWNTEVFEFGCGV